MPQKQNFTVPVAIVIAGLLIAVGIYASGRNTAAPAAATQQATASLDSIKPIQPTDHVLGNPNAKVVIVEYSDTECPYCKEFQSTLHEVMTTYGDQVAWVFRNFPVHQRSVHEAEAAECAAELGGNDTYWKYLDEVFAETNSNDSLDPAALPAIAQKLGLDVTKFNACVDSGKYEAKINQDKQDVINAGAQGTPFSVIFAGGQKIPITQGALPYDSMKTILDTVIKNS